MSPPRKLPSSACDTARRSFVARLTFYDMGGPHGPNVTRGHAEAELHYICSLEGCPLDDDVYVTLPETARTPT